MDPLTDRRPPPNGLTSATSSPIYDTCDLCGLSVRPGEAHGVIGSDDEGQPRVFCQIQKLTMTTQEIPARETPR